MEGLLDFGDLPVFEEATTYPCILTMTKSAPSDSFPVANLDTLDFEHGMRHYLKEISFQMPLSQLSPEGWTLSNVAIHKLLQKIKEKGVPLGEYVNGQIYRGVLTGLNEAFVIDLATKNRLVAEDPRSAEIIKPFLAGRDIKRYQSPKADKYLIFARRGIEIEQYPAILKHLEQYRERLTPEPKNYTGKNWPGRKAGTYKWYEIQDAVDYYGEFEKAKIVYPNICKQPEFTFETDHVYLNQKCFSISHFDKYLLAILNSKLTNFLFEQILPKLRGDFYEPGFVYLKDFPIVRLQEGQKDELSPLVTQILSLKSADPAADTTALEEEIDVLVYGLYGLDESEQLIVKS